MHKQTVAYPHTGMLYSTIQSRIWRKLEVNLKRLHTAYSSYKTFWKMQTTKIMKTLLLLRFGEREGWTGRTGGTSRVGKPFCINTTIVSTCHDTSVIPIECITPRVNHNANYELWVIMRCHCWFHSGGDVDRDCGYVRYILKGCG